MTSTTTTVPEVDLLAGVDWIQSVYASPCGSTNVQMIGGSAVHGPARAVLDDVVALQPTAGLAVAFLSCRGATGTTQVTAVLVKAHPWGFLQSVAELPLGADARVVLVDLPEFTVEDDVGTPAPGACCSPLVRRRQFTVSARGFDAGAERQVAAFEQTVTAQPTIGRDAELVRSSVPAAALCYRWDDVSLAAEGSAAEPLPPSEPSAELQTIRLALIHLTGQWIEPTSQMNVEMARVATAYQEARGLETDGIIGPETTSALASDLACPGARSFDQVDPPQLGPRRFRTVADLALATDRFARTGGSGNDSLDALLAAARWDGANALFLGCSRRETPSSGVSCAWSGPTPLQLIGLVDDADIDGVFDFSILYARSAAG